jgi:hypothetical protein
MEWKKKDKKIVIIKYEATVINLIKSAKKQISKKKYRFIKDIFTEIAWS